MKIIFRVIASMLLLSLMVGCTANGKKLPPKTDKDDKSISDKLTYELKRDYVEFSMEKYGYPEIYGRKPLIEQIHIEKYVGFYKDIHIVCIDGLVLSNWMPYERNVAGYSIVFGAEFAEEKIVHIDKEFYTLQEAYDMGIFDKKDIYEIGKMIDETFIERYPTYD